MHEFDDLARAGRDRIPTVQPPADGWERLRKDLANDPRPGVPPTRFGKGFAWGAMTGALLVFLLLRLLPGVAAEATLSPCAVAEPEVVTEDTRAREGGELTAGAALTPGPSPGERGGNTAKTRLVSEKNAVPSRPSLPQALEQKDTPSLSSLFNKPTANIAERPVASLTRLPTMLAVAHAPLDPFESLPPIRIDADATVVREPKWKFERVDREAQPAHRWEVGVSGFAWQQKQQFYGYGLSTSPTDIDDSGFVTSVNNESRTFYRENGFPDFYIDKRPFGFRTAYLEIAHQFPKGIRLGVGLLGIMDGSSHNRRPAEVFAVLGENREFTQVNTNAFRALYAAFNIQYTVFRRRRFRLSPGITLMNRITTTHITTRFVSVNQEVPSGSQSSASQSRNEWAPIPSLNFQYQLTRRISLSGDVLPGIGIGARYHFE